MAHVEKSVLVRISVRDEFYRDEGTGGWVCYPIASIIIFFIPDGWSFDVAR